VHGLVRKVGRIQVGREHDHRIAGRREQRIRTGAQVVDLLLEQL